MRASFRLGAVFLLTAAFLVAPVRALTAGDSRKPASADTGPDRPLPELSSFLMEVRNHLHSDEALLDQYTFTEKHVERELDPKGAVTKTRSETYEVYPSLEPGHTYRRLVEKDGKVLSSRELSDEDHKHEKKVGDDLPESAQEARRTARRAESLRRENSAVEQVFRTYDISLAGRESLDGRSTIILRFQPKSGVQPTGRSGKILKTLAGRAWIDEEDRQVARVDAELIEPLSFGLGILARLHKGSRASFVRRKINGEIWLPAQARFTGSARVLLLKGLRIDSTSEYSDYRKFHVGTASDFQPEPSPEAPEKMPTPAKPEAPDPARLNQGQGQGQGDAEKP